MGDRTHIQWTESTWNPFRGVAGQWHCVKVSEGCKHCYAERINGRFGGPLYRLGADAPRLDTGVLAQPLRWRRPRMVFVCSMTDLFLETHTDKEIAAIFGVMAAAPQHVFQVLTKRAERMRAWFEWVADERDRGVRPTLACLDYAENHLGPTTSLPMTGPAWPLPNVWLGVSAENQRRANERIPQLLNCPAAIRWVSAEPLLNEIDFRHMRTGPEQMLNALTGIETLEEVPAQGSKLDWIVMGGESGAKSRPLHIPWIQSIAAQCKAAGVASFVKQLGALPGWIGEPTGRLRGEPGTSNRAVEVQFDRLSLRDRKGGDITEWPANLQVREWPEIGRGDVPAVAGE